MNQSKPFCTEHGPFFQRPCDPPRKCPSFLYMFCPDQPVFLFTRRLATDAEISHCVLPRSASVPLHTETGYWGWDLPLCFAQISQCSSSHGDWILRLRSPTVLCWAHPVLGLGLSLWSPWLQFLMTQCLMALCLASAFPHQGWGPTVYIDSLS